MSFASSVEKILQEAIERGDFDHLAGAGKPIDLTDYFETPADLRVAYSVLKNAGMISGEAEILKEIADLKQMRAAALDEKRQRELDTEIQRKQIELNLALERQKRERQGMRTG